MQSEENLKLVEVYQCTYAQFKENVLDNQQCGDDSMQLSSDKNINQMEDES